MSTLSSTAARAKRPGGQERPGFTLVEMMVAMALIVFVMAIVSEAFVAGLESFRQLKAVGDMDEKMRSAVTLLRRDLRADHFGNLGQPLSQQQPPTTPPATAQTGFFRVYQGSQPVLEGNDPDNVPSFRSVDSMLHFTINLGLSSDPRVKTGRRENFLTAFLAGTNPASPLMSPPQTPVVFQDNQNFYSQWAEVAWFLRATGATANGTTPLFALYRRQLLAVANNTALNTTNRVASTDFSSGLYADVSCTLDPTNNGFIYFNSPQDLSCPVRRFGAAPTTGDPSVNVAQAGVAGALGQVDPITNTPCYPIYKDDPNHPERWGGDVVVADVLSFDVRLSLGNGDPTAAAGDFIDLWNPLLQSPSISQNNPAFSGAGTPRAYDTWTNAVLAGYYNYANSTTTQNAFNSMPLLLPPVQAIQCTLRVWDRRTQTTRQITVVQNM